MIDKDINSSHQSLSNGAVRGVKSPEAVENLPVWSKAPRSGCREMVVDPSPAREDSSGLGVRACSIPVFLLAVLTCRKRGHFLFSPFNRMLLTAYHISVIIITQS